MTTKSTSSITAFHPKAKLPKYHILYYFQLTDIDQVRKHAVAVITPEGLHSAEWSDGEIVNLKALKKLNKFHSMYNQDAILNLWKTYGFTKKKISP